MDYITEAFLYIFRAHSAAIISMAYVRSRKQIRVTYRTSSDNRDSTTFSLRDFDEYLDTALRYHQEENNGQFFTRLDIATEKALFHSYNCYPVPKFTWSAINIDDFIKALP